MYKRSKLLYYSESLRLDIVETKKIINKAVTNKLTLWPLAKSIIQLQLIVKKNFNWKSLYNSALNIGETAKNIRNYLYKAVKYIPWSLSTKKYPLTLHPNLSFEKKRQACLFVAPLSVTFPLISRFLYA